MKLKGKYLQQIFSIIVELIGLNEQPFKGQALILAYKLQSELDTIGKMSEENKKLLLDAEFNFNVTVPIPEVYGLEHIVILEMVCGELPKRETQAEELIKNLTKK